MLPKFAFIAEAYGLRRTVPGSHGEIGWYKGTGMKKPEIAQGMAQQSGLTEAEAADRLDGVVHEILVKLRKGRPAPLPGLGSFRRDRNGTVSFRREGGRPRD